MKKFTLILALFAFVAFANAQKVYTVAVDTLKGAETVNFGAIKSSVGSGVLTIQALCTQLGGTSDGSLNLYGSVDGTSWVKVLETAGTFHFYPNDTLTITNGAVLSVVIKDSPFAQYRLTGVGTSGDTTKVAAKYHFKN